MCMCLIIGHLIESQPSQRVPHDQSLQGVHLQMSAVNIYNPNVIGESGHGMFAIVIRVYKCKHYSIITYMHTLMFHIGIL